MLLILLHGRYLATSGVSGGNESYISCLVKSFLFLYMGEGCCLQFVWAGCNSVRPTADLHHC